MFIGWINQMLAILDKREGKAVQAILWEIAQTYPQVSITCTPFHFWLVSIWLLVANFSLCSTDWKFQFHFLVSLVTTQNRSGTNGMQIVLHVFFYERGEKSVNSLFKFLVSKETVVLLRWKWNRKIRSYELIKAEPWKIWKPDLSGVSPTSDALKRR